MPPSGLIENQFDLKLKTSEGVAFGHVHWGLRKSELFARLGNPTKSVMLDRDEALKLAQWILDNA
jgi:hypothetical protein